MSIKQVVCNEGPKTVGPYSIGINVGNITYLSSQLPLDLEGEVVGETISDQTKQCINNIESILKSLGLGLSNVIKTTVYLSDMNMFAKMNQIYAIYFSHPYPARTCVEVSGLAKGALIEIECIVSCGEIAGSDEICLECDE